MSRPATRRLRQSRCRATARRFATGGGTITSAANAIAFLGGTGQTATFNNFTISNHSADLIFADPSVATVNFNSTTANAGTNNLLDATAGSNITLNTNGSTLTGVIRTDPTSTSNVNLANRTKWTLRPDRRRSPTSA